ncbi:hypothetical protein [Caenispirillum bisanense]|uniref:HNH endonuclease n=1 Tax=Caenispirillum bisanense TaxID=414052 RepID=UPI0031D3301E
MGDAYKPALCELVLTEDEYKAIEEAMKLDKPWDIENAEIKSVKAKIRDHHLRRHGNTCCYCRTNLNGAGHFMIDREHVLPKSKYKSFTFSVWNLSVSCKRCNMQFKGECDKFVLDKQSGADFKSSLNYQIIHPNFDEWENYLCREAKQVNRKNMVVYTVLNDHSKGAYTHEYFGLKELEVNSFDEAQGIERRGDATETIIEARAIARDHGQ